MIPLGSFAKSSITVRFPKGFELEKVRGYEPNDRVTFDVWSVRLRIPGGTLPGGHHLHQDPGKDDPFARHRR
jgi:hypothetical protein